MPDLGRDDPRHPPRALPAHPAIDDLSIGRPHGDPVWRRVGRGAVRPFVPADEARAKAELAASIQRPVTTGRRIAVLGMRGGAGKSTIAALLATVFAHYRHDRVLALDVDPDLGSLPLRLGITRSRALADLAGTAGGFQTFADVESHLIRATERLWALPGNRGQIGDSPLDATIYRDTALPLTRFFGITLIDCGSGVTRPLPRAVLEGVHAQVLVAPATVEGARSVGRALDWMGSNGLRGHVPRTVAVFTVKSPHTRRTLDIDGTSAILAEAGVSCLKLDYDRHVASGAPISPPRLAEATSTTAVRLAALALDRALQPTQG
ncbi:AAA family ATPase [Actinomadura rupiterrae]|uniref:AAA family ATPase n=1 Tax=Actinomadura rupiterrae TaxID=559627 RepID=UPI0020A4F224|nr:hypothetical protein [Actinomadura rupiterrae]MCP2337571.1 MinD-like ATPase involved in chromosome partitioning or flagellar assembly [Actinomadura rupiterrae]